MTNQREYSSPRRKRILGIFVVVAAALTLCMAMKTFACGKFGDSCPCQVASIQADCGCSNSEDE